MSQLPSVQGGAAAPKPAPLPSASQVSGSAPARPEIKGVLPILKAQVPAEGFMQNYVRETSTKGIRSVGAFATVGPDGKPDLAPYSWTYKRNVDGRTEVVLTTAQRSTAPKTTRQNLLTSEKPAFMFIPTGTHIRLAEAKVAEGADKYSQTGTDLVRISGLADQFVPPSGLYLKIVRDESNSSSLPPEGSAGVNCFCDTFTVESVIIPQKLKGTASLRDYIRSVQPAIGRGAGPNWLSTRPLSAEDHHPIFSADDVCTAGTSHMSSQEMSLVGLAPEIREEILSKFFPFQTRAIFVPESGQNPQFVEVGTQRVEGKPLSSILASESPLPSVATGKLVYPTAEMLDPEGNFDLSKAVVYDSVKIVETGIGAAFETSAYHGGFGAPPLLHVNADRSASELINTPLPRVRKPIANPEEFGSLFEKIVDIFSLKAVIEEAYRFNAFTVRDYLRSIPRDVLNILSSVSLDDPSSHNLKEVHDAVTEDSILAGEGLKCIFTSWFSTKKTRALTGNPEKPLLIKSQGFEAQLTATDAEIVAGLYQLGTAESKE